jgi:serine/threonine protein kinase/tetratricopeptide (TPR) repeat protein
MTPSRPDNEAIFHAARDIPDPDRRREYVREACGGDEARIANLEALLVAADGPDSLLDRPAAGTTEATIDQPATESLGTVVGPYKFIEPIGEGGMGSVWMAQQTEPVKRLVAVKLIKAGMDSRQVIARFEAERQALALMDHANIARVLDAGTSSAGRPYFVMDLVKGMPITRYCDEHHLTPRQRLELFIPVCQAVQHAHLKGIIHRDLKPSNVLVALYDGRPVPKIIDFGVAKAAGPQLTDKTLVTGFGAIVGTLEYMSPEQAEVNQLDIDTRSDIYSLGVLLYELLTGSPPFSRKDLTQAGMLEMLRVIREEEPSKPSTKLSTAEGLPTLAANRGTEPARLTKLMRGELDWIVMKALEKDRNRRYETANGFAMDVQRYLADEPVQACPPSAVYRLRKFARRNKGALAVIALVLFFVVLLGSGVGWVLWDRSAREAKAARQEGERQAQLREAVTGALEKVTDLRQRARWGEAQAVLEQVRQRLGPSGAEDLRRQVKQAEADLALVDRLEAAQLNTSALAGSHFDHASAVREYATAFREAGIGEETEAAEVVADRIRSSAVREQLVAAVDLWAVQVDKEEPARRAWLLAVARAADPDSWRNRFRAEAVRNDRTALERLAREANASKLSPQILFALGAILVVRDADAVPLLTAAQRQYPSDFWLNAGLGMALHIAKRWEEAIGYYRAALALRPSASSVYSNLGIALQEKGRVDEAIVEYQKALELDPKNVNARTNLGSAFRRQGRVDEAVAEFRKAIELDPKFTVAHNNLGIALRDKGRVDEAIVEYQKAIELHPNYASPHTGLGNSLRDKGRVDEAIAEHRKAIELQPKSAIAHTSLGLALWNKGRVDEAIAEWKKVIAVDPKNAAVHYKLGIALKARGDLDEAIAAFEEVIRHQPDFAAGHFELASALAGAKQWDRSASLYAAALKRFGTTQWPGPWYLAIRSDEVFTRLTAEQGDDRLARIMRARFHVFEYDWKRAAAEYARVNESWASIDPAKLLREADDLFGYGCLLVLLGDHDGYEQFCKKWADRVGDSPAWGYSLARAWAACPRPVFPAHQIVERAKQTLQAGRAPWNLHVLSLAHYRNGEFELAAERALESNGGDWRGSAKALNGAVLAMAHSRLGHATDASKFLHQAEKLVGRASPDQIPGVNWPDMAPPDFVEFELLRREAEELINPKSKEKPDKK